MEEREEDREREKNESEKKSKKEHPLFVWPKCRLVGCLSLFLILRLLFPSISLHISTPPPTTTTTIIITHTISPSLPFPFPSVSDMFPFVVSTSVVVHSFLTIYSQPSIQPPPFLLVPLLPLFSIPHGHGINIRKCKRKYKTINIHICWEVRN